MAAFQLLAQAQEDELHKTRLLNVEEKPFKRITKRLLAPNSLLTTPTIALLPGPPDLPDFADAHTNEDGTGGKDSTGQHTNARQTFHADVQLDFAAFEHSIARLQFLLDANASERVRYATEKDKINRAANEVRESTVTLREKLDHAREVLERRKKFDIMAEKITGNRLLRPRDEQSENIARLEEEIRDLEEEGRDVTKSWADRRAALQSVMLEGDAVKALISGPEVNSEDVEEEGEEGEENEELDIGSRGERTPGRSSQAGAATPRVDSDAGGRTPAQPDDEAVGLKHKPSALGSSSVVATVSNSRQSSPGGGGGSPVGNVATGDVAMDDVVTGNDGEDNADDSVLSAVRQGQDGDDAMDTTS